LLGRLARTTSSGTYVPEIDGLRAVAILGVILIHLHYFIDKYGYGPFEATQATTFWQRTILTGAFGVPLFFAISAFIVGLPFARWHLGEGSRIDLKKYFWRRVTRLEPPYFINLMVLAVLRWLVDGWTADTVLPHFGASLAYVHNQVYGEYSIINAVAWSLEIEIQFYILAPLFAQVFRISNPTVRRVLIAGVAFLTVLLRPAFPRVQMSLLGQLEFFAVGFLVLDIYLTRWGGKLPRQKSTWAAAAVGTLLVFVAWRLSESPARSILLAIALATTMLGSLSSASLSTVLANRWICTFGGMCYTFYLYHTLVNSVVSRIARPYANSDSYLWVFLIQAVLVIPVITVVCSILFLLFEKPFMKRTWFTDWIGRGRKPGVIELEKLQENQARGEPR
jgi:peptidoglycan/LPS O-acetylase OafA/YrhL